MLPLLREFRLPRRPSSLAVRTDLAQLSQALSRRAYQTAYERFTPSKSGQRLPPTYYRGCWHVVSRGFFRGYRHYRPHEKEFTPLKASSSTRRCCVSLSAIAQNSQLLPPVGVWAVLRPSLADHPLRPASDHRPGEPLPHQLTNRPPAPPGAHECFPLPCLHERAYAELGHLSMAYAPHQDRLPTCSSAVRHCPLPERSEPFDLHV